MNLSEEGFRGRCFTYKTIKAHIRQSSPGSGTYKTVKPIFMAYITQSRPDIRQSRPDDSAELASCLVRLLDPCLSEFVSAQSMSLKYEPASAHFCKVAGALPRTTAGPLLEEGRCKATWKREFKLAWREAGPRNHYDDKVDSDL